MNRHAYMIIAHNDIVNLSRLIQALDEEYNDIYVHFDASQREHYSIDSLETKRAKLTIMSEISVHWGSFSMIECELLLLKEALRTEHSYYHLLSGADYPIKPTIDIYNYFESSGKEFILFSKSCIDKTCKEWVQYRHIGAEHFRQTRSRIINKSVILFDAFCVQVQKLIRYEVRPRFREYQKGSQWFSITSGFAQYILENQQEIEKNFRFSMIPDEMVIQTLAVSSVWKENLYNYSDFNSPIQNMRLIDWDRGKPYTFKKGDYLQLTNSDCCFARKFVTDVDHEIVQMLAQKNCTINAYKK